MAGSVMQQSRRDWMSSAGSTVLLVPLIGPAEVLAQETANTWQAAMGQVLKGATPGEGGVVMDLPDLAENGNTVPFSIAVDSPMTEASYVKSLHVFSTGNPQAVISTFYFTPASGRAAVTGRLRLARTQQIVALAAMSDGRFVIARREVKVTIGGCGG